MVALALGPSLNLILTIARHSSAWLQLPDMPMFRLLASLSTEYLVGGSIAALALVWLLGLIAHAVMRDRGFGVIGNAALIVAGAAAGFFARSVLIGPIYPG